MGIESNCEIAKSECVQTLLLVAQIVDNYGLHAVDQFISVIFAIGFFLRHAKMVANQ